MRKTLEKYILTKTNKSFKCFDCSTLKALKDASVLTVMAKDKDISGKYLIIPRSLIVYDDWNGCEQTVDEEDVVRMLLFNCSSKWLENYIDVDFRTLEILKDELGVLAYNELIWRFAEENLREGLDELVRLAVDYYDWEYFDLVEFEDIFIYKLNTKVEY